MPAGRLSASNFQWPQGLFLFARIRRVRKRQAVALLAVVAVVGLCDGGRGGGAHKPGHPLPATASAVDGPVSGETVDGDPFLTENVPGTRGDSRLAVLLF